MLNKEQIVALIQKFDFDTSQYWIAAGAAMVIYGIRDTAGDIDMGCTSEMADKLQSLGYPIKILKDGSRHILFNENIEIFENWGEGGTVYVDGIPIVSIDNLIDMKYQLGRDKDLKDIDLIKEKYGNQTFWRQNNETA